MVDLAMEVAGLRLRNPTMLASGLLNAVGLPNPGIVEFEREVRQALDGGAAVIGSVYGKDAHEYARCALKMEEDGVQAVELNLSCPHARGSGWAGSRRGATPSSTSWRARPRSRSARLSCRAGSGPSTRSSRKPPGSSRTSGSHPSRTPWGPPMSRLQVVPLIDVVRESHHTTTYRFRADFGGDPGQVVMVWVPRG